MTRLDETTPKVKYITRSFVPSPEATLSVLVISCTLATADRFDYQRGILSRAEYLNTLMDLADSTTDDFAELEY